MISENTEKDERVCGAEKVRIPKPIFTRVACHPEPAKTAKDPADNASVTQTDTA